MKSVISRIALGLALSLALVGAAEAAKLYSPPLPVKVGQSLECKILNTSDQTREVRIDMRTDENGLVSDMLMPPTMVPAGEVLTWKSTAGPCFRGLTCIPSYCKFTVQGSKNNYRASACVRDAGGWCRAAVEAR